MKRVVLLGLVILLGVWIVFPVASMKPDNGDRAREEITEEAVAALGRPVSVTVGEPVRDGGLLRYEGLAVSGNGSQSTAAAIHAWFDERSGAYAKRLDRAVERLARMEQGGMSASAVADDMLRVINADRPPLIKTCGAVNGFYRALSRVLPEKLTLRMAARRYGQ